jgi:hypothetical protein
MTLEPGEYTVTVANATKFNARYPAVTIAGQYAGRLDNGGEKVELALPLPFDGSIQDFTYDDAWFAPTDGGGPSLVVISPVAATIAWNESSGWRPSYAAGGSPGRVDLLYADQNGDGFVGLRDLVLLRNKLGSDDLTGDLNYDGLVDRSDLASFAGSYGTVAVAQAPAPSPAPAAAVVRASRIRSVSAEITPNISSVDSVRRGNSSFVTTSRETDLVLRIRRKSRANAPVATDCVMSLDETWSCTFSTKTRCSPRAK